MKPKIAFYGNNLNFGYFFVKHFTEFGLQAKLFLIEYPCAQELHEWWTDKEVDTNIVRIVNSTGFKCGGRKRLRNIPEIRQLYEEVKAFDVIMMMEDGPALFSELEGVKKVFLSAGADLQIFPFLLRVCYSPKDVLKKLMSNLGLVLLGNMKAMFNSYSYICEILSNFRFQSRQRKGLHQSDALICAPHQKVLIDQLNLCHNKIHYLTAPMDTSILAEIYQDMVCLLEKKYADLDILFFHPTRQFYLKEYNDKFMKDNDKLLYAYARFLKNTTRRVRLILILKGREKDIAHSQRLIRQMNLEDYVEWLPEMPNKKLRAYYSLEKVVVCDQYSPNLATLGNIGREATFYGKILITAFADWNKAYYGQDLPPNVFPAHTIDNIFSAMKKVTSLSREEIEKLRYAAILWFHRNLAKETLLPKYIDLILTLLRST